MEHEISRIKEYITTGKAFFTLKNEETDNRFTLQRKMRPMWTALNCS